MSEADYIYYLAHMLDESISKKYSYYQAFMDSNKNDRQPQIFECLIKEFSNELSRNRFDLMTCINENGISTEETVYKMLSKMNFHYDWDLIKANVYESIIKWNESMMAGIHGRYLEEETINTRRNISRNVLERCLDIICHNTNVLEANSSIHIYGADDNWDLIESLFQKYHLPRTSHMTVNGYLVKDSFYMVTEAYSCWARFYETDGANVSFNKYICNSDEGPYDLKNILNECPYDADDIDLIMTMNKCLDVTHYRGDLASAFIEGGSQTCQRISNMN